jgi:hypothetical protein
MKMESLYSFKNNDGWISLCFPTESVNLINHRSQSLAIEERLISCVKFMFQVFVCILASGKHLLSAKEPYYRPLDTDPLQIKSPQLDIYYQLEQRRSF